MVGRGSSDVRRCVFAESARLSHTLRVEDVIQVTGKVESRPEIEGKSTVNNELPTGEIEIAATDLVIVNKAEVLPFQLDKELSKFLLIYMHN